MKVDQLIYYLNSIENKDQEVYITNFDFSTGYPILEALEIKSSTDRNMYPRGVNLIANI